MPRKAITEFDLANPLYKGASVSFWTVVAGVKSAVLADLYASTSGTSQLANPQKLDSRGKFRLPVYIEEAVIGTIEGLSVATHDTGIIAPAPTFRISPSTSEVQYSIDGGVTWVATGDFFFRNRGSWAGPGTDYERNDIAKFGDALYAALDDHTSTASFANDLAATHWIVLVDLSVDLGVSAFILTLLDDANDAAARTTLGAVGLTGDETIAGAKTFSGNVIASGTVTVSGNVSMPDGSTITGSADTTKKVRFEVDGITAGQTRVLTPPNFDATLATLAGAETFTNKTLTSPVVTTPTLNGAVAGTSVATQAEQETGTATDKLVSPGRQHFHPSAAKGWVQAGVAGDTTAGYNVTSVTDSGAGQATINWATDLSSGVGAHVASIQSTGGNRFVVVGSRAAGTTALEVRDAATTLSDPTFYDVVLFGDMA